MNTTQLVRIKKKTKGTTAKTKMLNRVRPWSDVMEETF